MLDFVNTSALNCLYFGMLAAGLVFALGTLLMSGGGDADGDADVGDIDTDIDAGGGDLRIFSPVSLATFMAVFGAIGLIATIGFGVDPRLSLLIAGLVAAGLSLLVAYVYGRLLVEMHGSTDIRQKDMIGIDAMVITPIPVNGLGEVMFEVNSERITRPARALDNGAIARGTSVIIDHVTGVHVVVQQRKATAIAPEQPIDAR